MSEGTPRYDSDVWEYRFYWKNLLEAEQKIQQMKTILSTTKYSNLKTNNELEGLARELHEFIDEKLMDRLELFDVPETDEEAKTYYDGE